MPIYFIACNPVLYQPHTPNIPTVTAERPSELKVLGGLRNFDAHYNQFNLRSGRVVQGMASLSGASPYSDQDRNTLRLGAGMGWLSIETSKTRFMGLQAGFSTFNNTRFSAYDFGYIVNGGLDATIAIKGSQFHFGGLISRQFNTRHFSLNLSALLDISYSPRLRQTIYSFDAMVNHRDTSYYEASHVMYGVLNFQAQLNFRKYVQLSAGTKIPLRLRGYSPTYYSTEYVYVRLGLWLKWGETAH